MPSIRSLTVGKEALKKLSNAAIDYDVRPHELVDAIVVHTDWEQHARELAGYIKKNREQTPAPAPPLVPPSSPSFSEGNSVPAPLPPSPAPSAAPFPPPPRESEKSAKLSKGGRQSSARPLPALSESVEEDKI